MTFKLLIKFTVPPNCIDMAIAGALLFVSVDPCRRQASGPERPSPRWWTICWPNDVLMLSHHRRQWPSLKATSGQLYVLSRVSQPQTGSRWDPQSCLVPAIVLSVRVFCRDYLFFAERGGGALQMHFTWENTHKTGKTPSPKKDTRACFR